MRALLVSAQRLNREQIYFASGRKGTLIILSNINMQTDLNLTYTVFALEVTGGNTLA